MFQNGCRSLSVLWDFFVVTSVLFYILEHIALLKEEKAKAEDIKERALSFLKEKEASQRHLESELGLAQQQVKQYQEQLQSLGSDSLEPNITKSSQSVVKIR